MLSKKSNTTEQFSNFLSPVNKVRLLRVSVVTVIGRIKINTMYPVRYDKRIIVGWIQSKYNNNENTMSGAVLKLHKPHRHYYLQLVQDDGFSIHHVDRISYTLPKTSI